MTVQQPQSGWRRIPLAIRWIGLAVLVLIVILIVPLSITDWNFARQRIASFAGSKLHREVRIDGDLKAHFLSAHPQIRIEGLTIGNPDWARGNTADKLAENMASIQSAIVALNLGELFRGNVVFDKVEIDNPKVAIIGDEQGRYNFQSQPDENDKKKGKPKPPKLPALKHLSVRGGDLFVLDAVHKLKFKCSVAANQSNEKSEEIPFRLKGEGTLNDEPFNLDFQGTPLANVKMDEPYEFNADITAGPTHVVARGKFERAFDLKRVNTQLDIRGDNLAHLYYLTNLALPFTPPYHVSGDLQTTTHDIQVHELRGAIGKSDINGDVTVQLREERPKLVAKLKSKSLNLADLSPAFGKGVKEDASGHSQDSKAPGALPTDRLLPTYEFEWDRLKVMDAEVALHADSVQVQTAPFTGVEINVNLNDSILKLDPVVFALPLGKISASIQIDATKKPAAEKVDLRLSNVKLDQFKGKKTKTPPLDGVLQARVQLTGSGNSVHDFAASSNGRATVVIPHGEVRQAFAELTGINVAHGLGLLLTKNQQQSDIRCGVATLNVQDGTAAVDQMVFDTDTMLIKGDGNINLKSEKLDLDISGQPKKLRVVRLKTPIAVNGTLRKPSVGVDAKDTAKQVGIAAALASVFAPLAAAIAFIDPGLAKDQNCAALLAEAQKSVPTNSHKGDEQNSEDAKKKS